MRQAFLWALLAMLLLVLITPSIGNAQVEAPAITSTLGAGNLHTTVTHMGNLYDITGGTRPGSGSILFHSFGDFNVPPNTIANFLNQGSFDLNGTLLADGLATSNILARVTNPNPSSIFGTIQTNGVDGFSNANLFLMNPSGILFGPNASLNVGGSVSFTTAQYIRLFDGVSSANFYANPANDSLTNSILTVDPAVLFEFLSPAAYGFLTPPDPSATITVQGSALSVASGQSISLIGGKVDIQGATLPDGMLQQAQLSAPNGRIQLTSAASSGEFDVATVQAVPNVEGTSFTSVGSVSLGADSSIDVSGARTVFIKGGQLVLSVKDANLSTSESPAPSDTISLRPFVFDQNLRSPGGAIVTSTSGTEPGADVQITVGNLLMDGTMVQTVQSGDGGGGNISINATTVALSNGAFILSSTGIDPTTDAIVGSGHGGNVTLQGLGGGGSVADSVALSNFSNILSLTVGAGNGGRVQLGARTLTMENSSSITTGTIEGGGDGGDTFLNVRTVTLFGGSSIQSISGNASFFAGTGIGGNVIIQGLQGDGGIADSVVLSGGSSLSTQTFGGSEGGRVDIRSKTLEMDGFGTTFNTSAFDVGRGGDVVVSVQRASLTGGAVLTTQTSSVDSNAQQGPTITVHGLQGPGSMADSVVLSGSGSGIVSDSFGTARAGEIVVHAKTVTLTDGAAIQGSTPLTTAAASNVTIEADSVGISGGSSLSSQSFALDAGEVTITAKNALTLDKGLIRTNTSGFGRGGDVVIKVGSISLSNGAAINSSSAGLEADAGDAGNLTITASGPFTSNASTIATSAENAGGGNIDMRAQSVALSNNSEITSSSMGIGDAGDITIRSGSTVVMHNSVMTAEANQASGGQFTIITPELVWLTNSRISTSVFGSFTSSGGNITIDPQFVIFQNSQILANALFGLAGNINITAGVFLMDPNSFVAASGQLSISAPVVQNISGNLPPLSQEFSSAAALLLAQRCAADPTGHFSSFVQAGRDGVPQIPGALSPSPLSFLETLTSGSLGSPSPNWTTARLGLDSLRGDRPTQFLSACRS